MDGSTIANSRPKVGEWLRKGFRSCDKSAAMTAGGAKSEHGGYNVPGALQSEDGRSGTEIGGVDRKVCVVEFLTDH